MKRTVWNYLYMVLAMLLFVIGAADAFGTYRIGFLQGIINLPSLFVILGGSFFQAYAGFPAPHVTEAIKQLVPTLTLKSDNTREEAQIGYTMDLARGLRTDRHDTITKLMDGSSKGFRLYLAELLSTNYGAEEIRVLGYHKIHTMRQAEMGPLKAVNVLSSSSPAYGMLGTLMGLIVMLGNFENAAGLASGLALALMTTFYGLLLTQFVWQPVSKKIAHNISSNQLKREMELEAILLTMENKPELYIIDQLSSMLQAREGASNIG